MCESCARKTSSSFAINRKDCSKDPSASSGGLCLRMRSSRSRFERCSAVISTGNSRFPI